MTNLHPPARHEYPHPGDLEDAGVFAAALKGADGDYPGFRAELIAIGYEMQDSNAEGTVDASEAVRILFERHLKITYDEYVYRNQIGYEDRLVELTQADYDKEFKKG